MKLNYVYMDVPGVDKVSIWYAAKPSRLIDESADALIAALQKDNAWYSQAMIKMDLPQSRVVIITWMGKERVMRILRFRPVDEHDFPKALLELRALMEREMAERNGGNQ